jgi:hypothetical protein
MPATWLPSQESTPLVSHSLFLSKSCSKK